MLIALLLLLIAAPAWGVVAVNGTASVGATGSTTAAVDLTTGGTNTVLTACVYTQSNVTVSAFTYGAESLTQVHREVHGSGFVVEMWRKIAPLSGLNSLSVTVSGSTNIVLGGVNFSGAHQVSPIGTPVASSGASADPFGNDVTGDANGLVLDCALSGLAITVGAGQSEHYNIDNGDASFNGMSSTEGGAGTITMNWTGGGADSFVHVAALVSPAAAAADDRRKVITVD
jgi:hypothetical protein